MTSFISHLRSLNLFPAAHGAVADEFNHRSHIIATRFYLISLLLGVAALGLGIGLSVQTRIITLDSPTIAQITGLPTDARCPCSRLSFPYGSFVTLGASFHQVCSSDFVSDRWIKALFVGWNANTFLGTDFRVAGSAQFQGLAGLCRLLRKNVQNSVDSFQSTSFISSKVLFRELLESTIQSVIEQFQSTMFITFQSQLDLINKLIYENSFISGLQTTRYFAYQLPEYDIPGGLSILDQAYGINNATYGSCFISYDNCNPSQIYSQVNSQENFTGDNQPTLTTPGFLTGCMPINSLLQSTLECFFNQSCIDLILSSLSNTDNFTAMSLVKNSSFAFNTSLSSIVHQMMIEQWAQNVSYEKYFTQCAPLSCVYSINQRHDFVVILAQIIGLLGGLTLIFELMIPLVVRLVRNAIWRKNKTRSKMTLSARLNQLRTFIKRKLIEFNLFKSHTQDDRHVYYQQMITRLYALVITVASVVIILYFSLIEEVHRDSLVNPTELQYDDLYNVYSDNLVCSCTSLSVQHEMFLSIEPVYHQLCSSDFVSAENINLLLIEQNGLISSNANRLLLGFRFQLFRTLCTYAQQTINNSRRAFLQTQLVSSQVVVRELFSSQINQLIEDWKLNTINGFQRVLQLIRATNEGNKLINTNNNFQLGIDAGTSEVSMKPSDYSTCSCDLTQTCYTPSTIPVVTGDAVVGYRFLQFPWIGVGCNLLETTLQSTLECLYNQDCVTQMQMYGRNWDKVASRINSSLKITDPQSNETTETIETIVDRLMINSWLKNISFSSYYNSCAPASCQFDYTSRRSIYTVITTAISVIGGLSTLVRIFALIAVRLMEKMIEHRARLRLIASLRSMLSCHNEQQIARRLHVILLLITLLGFYLISFVPPQTITHQITQPSFVDYNDAFRRFPDSIQCSCSKISFPYQTFLSIQPRFHSICSSDFVTNNWTLYVYQQNSPPGQFNYTDFRATALGQFQLLVSFCQLTKQTVDDAIMQLNTADHFDMQLITMELFDQEIDTIIHTFQSTTPSIFLNILDLIREVTGANQLMNMYLTNWQFENVDPSQASAYINTTSLEYEGCNCGVTSTCTQPSRGMRSGCYPLEALLQSTLQCFYDQQCIDANGTFQALNYSSMSTHFDMNVSIERILEELMVEEYLINKSYEMYYAQCAPSSCSYSYIIHGNIINIVTSVLGLYGGLVIICGWITTLIIKLYRCGTHRIQPETIFL